MKKQYDGVPYDSQAFFWAVMYKPSGRAKPHITTIHTRYYDARREVLRINSDPFWSGRNMWSVKRFFFKFKGTIIDAYAHEREVIAKR